MVNAALARRIAVFALAATAALGLTACTISPAGPSAGSAGPSTGSSASADASGDEGQSVEDACALVQDTISEATEEFENVGADDPAAVVASIKAAADRIAAASSQVTNDQVAAILPSLQDMFAQVGETMTALVEGDVTKLGDLSTLSESFQETTQKFQEICAP